MDEQAQRYVTGHEDGAVEKGPQPAQVQVDPYNPETYMRFVATAAVDLLGQHLRSTLFKGRQRPVTRGEIAKAAFNNMKASNLSAQLGRPNGPTPEFLSRLERQYLCRRHPLHNGAPWLTSFHEEQHRLAARSKSGGPADDPTGADRHEPVRIPIGWFYNLAEHPPRNSTEAFVDGHALRGFLSDARDAAKDVDPPVTVEELLKGFDLDKKAARTVAALLEVVAGPPHRGVVAVRLVASFRELALDQVRDFIFDHPAGFRAVRILARILSSEGASDPALLRQVEELLLEIHSKEPHDPYPARSLIVEALRFAPIGTGNGDWSWVTKALQERTQRDDRPVRERAYAAYVLFDRGHQEGRYNEAMQVTEEFTRSSEPGLTYAAAFLAMLFKSKVRGTRTPYPWPHDRMESSIVAGATKILDDDKTVPYSVRAALREMVRGALLTIDGTIRRRICEAIQAAGLASNAINGLRSVIEDASSPAWLIEHAAFITGYLQTGYPDGSGRAIAALAPLAEDSDRPAAVRHAALWGIGDIVGSTDDLGVLAREWLTDDEVSARTPAKVERMLAQLVKDCSKEPQPEVRHAATYTGAMLARRCAFDKKKTSVMTGLLKDLAGDDDPLVQGLAQWGVRIEAARLDQSSYLAPVDPTTSQPV